MICGHYATNNWRSRCKKQATVWLICPEGDKVSYYCKAHAEATVKEYREKLHENWTTEPITYEGVKEYEESQTE